MARIPCENFLAIILNPKSKEGVFAEETRSIYDIHLFANLSKHSLDFSVSSQQYDERRRDYRVEDSMYGASA